MRLWWDLVSDKGMAHNWGRSQGLVSYLDTLEIAAFLGEHPEFRPAGLKDIAAVYNLRGVGSWKNSMMKLIISRFWLSDAATTPISIRIGNGSKRARLSARSFLLINLL